MLCAAKHSPFDSVLFLFVFLSNHSIENLIILTDFETYRDDSVVYDLNILRMDLHMSNTKHDDGVVYDLKNILQSLIHIISYNERLALINLSYLKVHSHLHSAMLQCALSSNSYNLQFYILNTHQFNSRVR